MKSSPLIKSLVNLSTSCSQSIQHTCTVNALTNYASWIGRDGKTYTYWSGSRNSSDVGCQCSLDGTCARSPVGNPICNCDSGGVGVKDIGVLSDKKSLPVKFLRYGSFTKLSSIKYILGRMKCEGKDGMFPSETFDYERKNISSEMEFIKNKLELVDSNLQNNRELIQNKTQSINIEMSSKFSLIDTKLSDIESVIAFRVEQAKDISEYTNKRTGRKINLEQYLFCIKIFQ